MTIGPLVAGKHTPQYGQVCELSHRCHQDCCRRGGDQQRHWSASASNNQNLAADRNIDDLSPQASLTVGCFTVMFYLGSDKSPLAGEQQPRT
jgi:hypothetical protein